MQKCKYSERAGCKKCQYTIYRKCKLFVQQHTRELAKEILPFKYKPTKFKGSILYSNNRDLIKSVAVERAIEANKGIKRVTLNQAINIVISKDDLPVGVYFIDCFRTRGVGDLEKVSSVLVSFIDKCQYNKFPVFIFKPSGVTLDLSDYKKIV